VIVFAGTMSEGELGFGFVGESEKKWIIINYDFCLQERRKLQVWL
jgi:hypothetical protein